MAGRALTIVACRVPGNFGRIVESKRFHPVAEGDEPSSDMIDGCMQLNESVKFAT